MTLEERRVGKPPVAVDEVGYRRPYPPGRRFPSVWFLATLLGDVVVSLCLWLFLGWDPLNAVGVSSLSATALVVVFWAALNRRDRSWLRWVGVWFLLAGIGRVIA